MTIVDEGPGENPRGRRGARKAPTLAFEELTSEENRVQVAPLAHVRENFRRNVNEWDTSWTFLFLLFPSWQGKASLSRVRHATGQGPRGALCN